MAGSIIDLKLFAQKYRQALLFTMIEGLIAGKEFCFLDDRNPNEVEDELRAAGLKDYKWTRTATKGKSSIYLIQRT